MSIGNLKDSGNQGNNFPWQLKVLQGLQLIADTLQVENNDLQTIIDDLQDILSELQAQSITLSDINGSTFSIDTNITNAFTGTFTPAVILMSDVTSYPYTFPDLVFKGFTIIVPAGETIEFEGATLPAGTYSFSGEGDQKGYGFQLDNPSTAPLPSGVIILTIE